MLISEGGQVRSTDALPVIPKPGTMSATNVNEGQKLGRLVTKDAQLVVYDDADIARIVIGQRNDGSYGARVSKPTKDGMVHDALTGSPDEMVMNSDFNSFKIIAEGSLALTKAANTDISSASVLVPTHGPAAFLSYFQSVNDAYLLLPFLNVEYTGANSGKVGLWIRANTQYDSVNDLGFFQVVIETPQGLPFYAPALTYYIKYFVLQETAGL